VDTVEVVPGWLYILILILILCALVFFLYFFILRIRVSQIRAKLHDSEENYSILFHAARDYILISSFSEPDSGKIIDVNDSFCRRTGFAREELLNFRITDILEHDRELKVEEIRNTLLSAGHELFETRFPLKEGGSFPVEILSQVFEKNSRKYIISVCRDLSAREEFKTTLSAMEQKYSTIADYNYDWEVWRNDDGRFAYISQSCERISGYTPHEFMADPELLNSIIHPEDRTLWDKHSISEDSGDVKDLQFRILRKDGEMRWIQHDCRRILSAEGVSLGIRGNFRDVTERIKLEEQLAQKQRLESLGVLAGGIAHDFNNILAIIKGYSDIARNRYAGDEDLHGIFESINQAAGRAENLTGQILDFSRNRKIQKRPVRISGIVEEVLKLIKPSFPSDISIVLNLDSQAQVLADEGQMHRVIVNICTNARLAMPRGGELTISVSELYGSEIPVQMAPHFDFHCLQICFKDTGTGMTEEVKNRIFDPFFTTRKAGEGTGMGLSVVHGLITEWGGQVGVESLPGAGTTLCLYLPVTASVKERKMVSEPVDSADGKGHVLVMDDEEILLKLMAIFLEGAGYSAECFSNPVEGVDAFRKNPGSYRFAVLDMTMPGMKGTQAALQLKEIRTDLPVLLCSGFSDGFDENRLPPGVDAFLYKPFGRDDLLREISKMTSPDQTPAEGEEER